MRKKTGTENHFRKSKLIDILKTFSGKELKDFVKFAGSDFFNKRNDVLRLLNALKKYHPLFNSESLTKENIYSKVYPGSLYKDNVMNRMLSNLKSLADNYLSYNFFSKDEFQTKYSLIRELLKRKLDRNLEKEFIRCGTILNPAGSGINNSQFKNTYLLEDVKYIYNLRNKKVKSCLNDPDALNCLIVYFLNELYDSLFEMLSEERVYNKKLNYGLSAALMKSFNDKVFFENIEELNDITGDKKILLMISFYSYYALLDIENHRLSDKLQELLNKFSDKLDPSLARDYYGRLTNIYAAKAQIENSDLNKKNFEIYKTLTEKKLLMQKDTLHNNHILLTNIIWYAVDFKEFKWAESFLEENIKEIIDSEKKSTYYYCKALLAYAKNDLIKAMSFAIKVKSKSRPYLSKILLCKIYYGLDYSEQLLSCIDSFRHFYNNDKNTSKDIKIKDLTFIRHLKKLATIKYRYDNKGIFNFKNDVENYPYWRDREWFKRKIDELMKTLNPESSKSIKPNLQE